MNKKKIGGVIVSDLNHNNYGSALQAYATMKTVIDAGYDLTFIKYKKNRSFFDWLKIAPGLMLSGGMGLIKKKLNVRLMKKKHPDYARNQKLRFDVTNAFKYIEFVPFFREYVGYESLCEGSKEFDAIFVGSDQTWRPFGYYSNYWNLNFVEDSVPKFSYAASYGVSDIPIVQKAGTKRYLERLDMISVREIRAKEIVEYVSTKTAKVVADPTMLRTRKQWLEFASKSKYDVPTEKYVFCYFLGPRRDIRDEATIFAHDHGMKVLCFPHMEEFRTVDEGFGDIVLWDANAYDFVNLLNNAEYVCTDSFHGSVFSILLHKKFRTYYREYGKSTNSRIDSLLGIFDLKQRLAVNSSIERIKDDVDYNAVDYKLADYRKESLDFFKKALSLAD